jgi:hypothetical protein
MRRLDLWRRSPYGAPGLKQSTLEKRGLTPNQKELMLIV